MHESTLTWQDGRRHDLSPAVPSRAGGRVDLLERPHRRQAGVPAPDATPDTFTPIHVVMLNSCPLDAAFSAPSVTVYCGDSVRVLRSMPAGSVDSVVCDPPYAIAPVGDVSAAFAVGPEDDPVETCVVCGAGSPADGLQCCGACLTDLEVDAFAASGMLGQQSQNWHESATHSRGYADNDARQFGRWCVLWARECLRVLKPGGNLVAFGGTRTWHRLAVAIEDAGFEIRDSLAWLYATGFPKSLDVPAALAAHAKRHGAVAGVSGSAVSSGVGADWAGWGTALKPAHEPMVLARKPLDGTVARTVRVHGTGAINIDGGRLGGGRWPSNVFMDVQQAGVLDGGLSDRPSRFFRVAKPDQSERVSVDGVTHPTVKPLALMQELVRLVTPPGGVCLDPFAGSGTTVEACLLEGFESVAVERDAKYLPLIRYRVDRRTDPVAAIRSADPSDLGLFELFD